MYQIFIHSSIDGYLECSHVLAIVSSVATNIQMYVLLSYGFLRIYAQ